MWKREEIIVLLKVYLTAIEGCGGQDEDNTWDIVSEKLKDQEINASAAHCRSKWNFLLKMYLANPTRDCAFNKHIKQILDTIKEIAEKDDIKHMEEENEALDRDKHVSNEGDESVSYMLEELDNDSDDQTPPVDVQIEAATEDDVVMALLQKLSSKIDTLTEMQQRHEANIQEIHRLQLDTYENLLKIKDRLGMDM